VNVDVLVHVLVPVALLSACDRSPAADGDAPALVAWPAYCADEPDPSAIPSGPVHGAMPGIGFAGRSASFGGCAPGHETAGASWITLESEDGARVEVRFGSNGNAPGTYVLGGPRRANGFEGVDFFARASAEPVRLGAELRGVLVLGVVDPPHGKVGFCARAADGRMLGVAGTF